MSEEEGGRDLVSFLFVEMITGIQAAPTKPTPTHPHAACAVGHKETSNADKGTRGLYSSRRQGSYPSSISNPDVSDSGTYIRGLPSSCFAFPYLERDTCRSSSAARVKASILLAILGLAAIWWPFSEGKALWFFLPVEGGGERDGVLEEQGRFSEGMGMAYRLDHAVRVCIRALWRV